MRRICSAAMCTMAFIGTPTLDTDAALNSLAASLSRPLTQSGMKGVRKVESKACWERAWIMQEIACSRNVVMLCGQWVVDVDSIFELLHHPNIHAAYVGHASSICDLEAVTTLLHFRYHRPSFSRR